MSKLEELIQELCPDGVEYKSITDVFDIRGGYTPSKSNLEYWTNGTIPWFRMEDIRENGHVLSKALQYVSQSAVKKNGLFPANSIALATSATIGEHALITVECLGNQRFTFFSCKEKYNKIINMNFMNHYFCVIDEWCKEHLNQGSFASVDMTALKKLEIPVPPLEVQKEIVRLLDDFTAKTTELQAELNKEYEARKKQYEYYRETVLNDNLDSMKVKIGDVADLKAGATPKTSNPEFWENGTIPWMSSGEVNQGKVTYTEKKITELGYNSSSTKMLPSETVVIALAGQGKTRGTVAITQIPLCTNQSLCGICAKDELNSMYLYHYLKSRYEDLRAISNGDGTRGGLNLKMIANYDIPLPPLEVQMKIVNILDKLDSINNDMYSSINNEIESRQKQYEFYRDKLLTFKELK